MQRLGTVLKCRFYFSRSLELTVRNKQFKEYNLPLEWLRHYTEIENSVSEEQLFELDYVDENLTKIRM